MTGSPALLLLLTLGLCCPRIHGHRYQMTATFRNSRTTHPQVGQRLELECQTTRDDGSIFWIHQDKGGTLHFIVFTSSLSQNNFKGNTPISTRFEAKKYGKSHHLVVKSFSPQDEGNYFCLMNINRVLYFSPPLPVLLPVVTTITTVAPTTQHNITEKDPCLKTRDPETSKEKDLNFLCDIFIWVPLAGTCLLLLIALAVTIALCQQTRRRRCRCKRPANGKPNVKPSMPSHHI
ncbi:T-cell surface glycoprotein CD8 alpha chain isoform X2 [Falco rusticolus]|uniref:T-cell surface glycoprotein CD8 alpha chain n=1 Tax=Falco peregrinus TaxID=8954 RepID=UPI0003870205|nr:T-cell surface glycoprotein CD8 alpha chain [Falco peregrinus]XP_005446478.1 T-cell surface glycoprotein CD8 alpha chain [Falco cherrug]XP_037243253.1 T-cell surface glycoprotein CD8 alpha chain isoform X2 [Falco rusticolus]XP_055583107.1 T-cell surface glycoprotein CD8 alpha chain [Falco cherrug]XP_055652438.1 T-cell surface glycoprotein CD8 alpha chain [Falco peregrinus]